MSSNKTQIPDSWKSHNPKQQTRTKISREPDRKVVLFLVFSMSSWLSTIDNTHLCFSSESPKKILGLFGGFLAKAATLCQKHRRQLLGSLGGGLAKNIKWSSLRKTTMFYELWTFHPKTQFQSFLARIEYETTTPKGNPVRGRENPSNN